MELEELRKLKKLRIEGETKQELVQKICSLYGWTKKRITHYYLEFSNYEIFFYHYDYNSKKYYVTIVDTKYFYNKAKKKNII